LPGEGQLEIPKKVSPSFLYFHNVYMLDLLGCSFFDHAHQQSICQEILCEAVACLSSDCWVFSVANALDVAQSVSAIKVELNLIGFWLNQYGCTSSLVRVGEH
jgi:hypothetical protein